MRCAFCPIPPDAPFCAGGDATRRYCELLDPGHVSHHPGYAQIVINATDEHNGQPTKNPQGEGQAGCGGCPGNPYDYLIG